MARSNDAAAQMLQEFWAEGAEVINTYPLAKLRRFLNRKEAQCHTTMR